MSTPDQANTDIVSVPDRMLTRTQKMRMASMVRRGILEAIDPEVMIPRIAEKLGIDEDLVTACFDRFSAYTREQLIERAKLLKKDREALLGLHIERCEMLYGIAIQAGDLKVALGALKEAREVINLGLKRKEPKPKADPINTTATPRVSKMTDEELAEAAKNRNG